MVPKLLVETMIAITAKNRHMKKLKKKGGSGADRASTSRKQSDQAGVAEETVEEHCDVLPVNPDKGKRRFSDA